MQIKTKKMTVKVSESIGSVSAELIETSAPDALYVFAHGAGAGMNHSFMVALAKALAERSIGTIRFNFPFVEKGAKRPDVPAVAQTTVTQVIEQAYRLYGGVPLLAGGKSFGGRMTSHCMATHPDLPVRGLVFVGFPLHAPGKASVERAAHLSDVRVPMLFLQGTRDALADITLIRRVTEGLKLASLKEFEGADHSFRAGKKDLIPPLADAMVEWSRRILVAA